MQIKGLRTTRLGGVVAVPDIEMATSVRRDKLVIVSWYPFDTSHSCVVNRALCTVCGW